MKQVIPPSSVGRTAYERVMGHAPQVLGPWTQLEQVFETQALRPADLLGQVRRTLAQAHGCAYCRAKGASLPVQFIDSHEIPEVSENFGQR